MTSSFPDADQLLNQITTLEQQLDNILDDFTKYYIFYNKTPDNKEYQNAFANVQSLANSSNAQLFMLSNSVQSNINVLNQKLTILSDLIEEERNTNENLKRKLSSVKNQSNASIELIGDYKNAYNIKYIRNWAVIISISIISGIIYTETK